MANSKQITLLRISYWAGAIVDALVIIPLLSPRVGGMMFGIRDFNPGNDYRYAAGVAAVLMLGWVALLIWADRKPVERKDVLLLTIFPVLVGLIIVNIYAVQSDLVMVSKMLPTWIMQGLLMVLFGFSYLCTRNKHV